MIPESARKRIAQDNAKYDALKGGINVAMKVEVRRARENAMYYCEDAIDKFKDTVKVVLQLEVEELYGGPKEWRTSVKGTEEANEFATDIWNEALEACIEVIKQL